MKSRTQQEEEEKQPLISTEDRHQDCPVKTTSCRDASSVSSKCVFGRKLAMIGLGLAVVASALCYMTDSNGTPIRYQLYNFYDSIFGGYGSDNPTFACSGHGIKVYGDKCLCDLGYSGEECSDVYPTGTTPTCTTTVELKNNNQITK
ncbi:hypothetical protein BCR33DRAFT_357326 [Rhizoclosmatium globosum]|uniref:EGF-like domain-containing protein n=1 Tax=Rhizoclosmatium globosum TaxID=329046 RepID=A0A1Y2C121_9FUNG|nr:hypothetical protein BCR33DRAFT_357326 [Rhizoclosmatium globosum]|eukprot:ORY40719.1 hypothetical protein BCR33DRAFT_357326 [Rhizoclosmatium globosum]